MPRTPPCDHLRGIWITGKTGIGKSVYAREHYPDYYPKDCNKWWDGYRGEKNVIMDDMAPEHGKFLATYMKHWGDHQQCVLQTKGGAEPSRHEWFVVTSQYTIHEVFGENSHHEAAIQRRFKTIRLPFAMTPPQAYTSSLSDREDEV